MKHNKIPCSKQCLKYAVCITKTEIECNELLGFYLIMYHEEYDLKWDEINKALPNIKSIKLSGTSGFTNPYSI